MLGISSASQGAVYPKCLALRSTQTFIQNYLQQQATSSHLDSLQQPSGQFTLPMLPQAGGKEGDPAGHRFSRKSKKGASETTMSLPNWAETSRWLQKLTEEIGRNSTTMSLVFSGSQANAKLIFFPDTYKIKTHIFPVFLCHLLSHDLHATGNREGAHRSCAILCLQAGSVCFTQQLAMLRLPHAVNNDLKDNYLLYLHVVVFTQEATTIFRNCCFHLPADSFHCNHFPSLLRKK